MASVQKKSGKSKGAREPAEQSAFQELAALRKLATTAVRIFEAEGILGELTAAEILGEALRCNRDELILFGDAISGSGSGLDTMHLQRAKDRIDLALALAEYREDYGPIKSPWGGDDSAGTVALDNAEGGAS